MKKIYTLSLLIAVSSSFYSTSTIGQNLLENPSFESGVLAPWFGDNDNTVTIVMESAVGDYAAVGNAAQNVELEAGVNYELRCKAKIISVTGEEKVWIGVRGPSALVQNARVFETDWENMEIKFTAPETGTHKIWIWGQGSSSYSSDDWVLLKEGTVVTSVNNQEAREKIRITNNAEGVSINMTNLFAEGQIMIHDFSGRLIYTSNTSITNLIGKETFQNAGIYIVTVKTDQLHRVEKVAITRN